MERELEQVTQINAIIGKLIGSIEKTNSDIEANNETIEHTNKLLNQWIRILSQTNYTRDLINQLNQKPNNDDIDLDINEKEQSITQLNQTLQRLKQENSQLLNSVENEPKRRKRY